MYYKYNNESLNYVKVNWLSLILKIGGGFLVLFFVMGLGVRFNPKTNYNEAEIMIVMGKYNQFTEEKLIDAIKKKNYKFPYIIFAQAKIESANFKSQIFLNNHNLFGMKEAVKRLNTARETQYGHALYENWRESLEDYGYYYCTYLSQFDTEEEYYDYLSQNYAEDPRYVTTLKAMIANQNLKSKFN